MKNKLILLIIPIIVIPILFLNIHIFSSSLNKNLPSTTPIIESNSNQEKTISIKAENDNINALDLLKKDTDLSYKEYEFGAYIEGVNGLFANSDHYWAVYLNGDYSQTGIDSITLKKDDTIELKYEEIQK